MRKVDALNIDTASLFQLVIVYMLYGINFAFSRFSRCNGVTGICPRKTVAAITFHEGQARLTFSDFSTPITFQSSTDKLHLQLNGFSVSCGLLAVTWSVIKAQDSCYLGNTNATLASHTNNHVLTGLSLQNTETYKVVVQSSNIRGQFGSLVCSNPVTIDTNTPTGGWVHLEYQSNKVLSATWGGFQSTYGIAKYEVAVYTKSLFTNRDIELQGFVDVNLSVSFTKQFPAITDGSKATTRIRAYTQAGLYTEVVSNGVVVGGTSKSLAAGSSTFAV